MSTEEASCSSACYVSSTLKKDVARSFETSNFYGLYGFTSQKAVLITVTAVITSNEI
jgi:hypothetical protein